MPKLHSTTCYPRRADRRGAMLPLIAVLLPVMVALIGFSVDLAYMQLTRLEMQVAADSAARAGATMLSLTDNKTAARQEAKRIAQLNTVAGEAMLLRNSDVVFGHSDLNDDGTWSFVSGNSDLNAVQVNAQRTRGSRGGTVGLFFGPFFGKSEWEPIQSATASFVNIDICLVLDRSTSMKLEISAGSGGMYVSDPRFCSPPVSGSRWEALDSAVRVFVDTLEDTSGQEHVALATYSSAITPVVYCGNSEIAATLDAPLQSNLGVVENALDTLNSTIWNGNTDIESGMRIGITELTSSNSRANAEKFMIVFTDGYENVGSAAAAAQDAANKGIQISTVTLGANANQTLMKSVASLGNGKHLHASTAQDLEDAFRELAAHVSQLIE